MIKKNIKEFIGVLCFALLFTGASIAQPTGYNYYKVVTFNTSQTYGNNTNFPVLISVTDTDLRDNVENSNGYDIIFTDDANGNNILDHQIESYNSSTGEYIAWVKKPTVSDANNTLYMWYGNSSVNSDPSTNQTWSEDFRSVYHFNNTFNDASPNGRNGTNNGTTSTTGKIGSARNFDGNNDYIALNDSYSSSSESAVTLAFWIKTTDSDDQIIMSYDRNEYWRAEINGTGAGSGQIGWDVYTDDGQSDFGSSNRIDDGDWHYVVLTYNNGTSRIYIDGIQDVSTNDGNNNFGSGTTRYGFIGVGSEAGSFDASKGPSDYMDGQLDEISISDVERSSNWIRTAYNNQNDPSGYLSFGAEQVINVVTPTTPTAPVGVSATAIANGQIEVNFYDVPNNSQIVSYSIKRSTTQGGPYSQVGTVTDNNSSTYSFIDTTPVNETTYYYIVTSIDQNSNESDESIEVSATADNAAPTVESILAAGTTLLLDYDELLDANSVPSPSDFTVKINGNTVSVASVSVSNVRVNLELNTSVESGDNVTLSYASGTNKIRDIATNNAANFTDQNVGNYAKIIIPFGPDPCPITNGSDVSWACFDGTNGGTSMTAKVGDLELATITAASGSQTTFSPNALQEWSSGAFSGDEFNGPQANPSGNSGNATDFDINIPSDVSSDALILSLNKLSPNGGSTSYTIEAFNSSNAKVPINGWLTGQGGDGGVCSNSINLNYTNGNTTLELQPTVSSNPSCASSSNPIWFKITSTVISRIEVRKTVSQPDNIHVGMAIVADFGDAPNTYRTNYNSRGNEPAIHILRNVGSPSVYLGTGVDADGNGIANAAANSDNDEGIASFPILRTNDDTYTVDLTCTSGGKIGAWIDFNQNGSFDNNEYAYSECSAGNATITWNGISGLIVGQTYARFRIGSTVSEIANPFGIA